MRGLYSITESLEYDSKNKPPKYIINFAAKSNFLDDNDNDNDEDKPENNDYLCIIILNISCYQ